MWEQSANKNWKCISSGIDERRAEPLWHFHDFGAVMQISRLDYLYILQTKCHFWHFANSLEDWPFGIIITCVSYHLKISWQDGSRCLQLYVTRENQQTLCLCYYYYYVHLTAFFRTTRVSRHQKGKPFWILVEQEMMWWQWHQLDRMQIICTSLQTDNNASTSPLSFYRADDLPAAQPTVSKHWRHLAR